MHLLNATDLSIAYGPDPLLAGVNFALDSEDKIGLIGSNGAGKSTLAKILAGIIQPDTGSVTIAGDSVSHYLPQQPLFDKGSAVLTEVFRGEDPALDALHRYYRLSEKLATEPQNEALIAKLAQASINADSLGAWELAAKGEAALNRLGVTGLQRSVTELSGGEQKRVALARALISPVDLLILDEPTNHLDSQAILWLEEYLLRRNGALILITHDRQLLRRVANRILAIDGNELVDCPGGYRAYLEQKAQREEVLAAAARKHRAALKRELTWMLQGAQGRGTKEKARKKLFKELNRQTDVPARGKVDLAIPAQRLGKKVVQLTSVSKSLGGRSLISDFSYNLLPRDRIGIVGPNGSGKTTLLNIIAGVAQPDSGAVERGETVKIGYYRQQAEDLKSDQRVIQYIQGIRYTVNTDMGESISAEKMLERFLFSGPSQWTYISELSGGERQRLYLLGILMDEPNVLLLDEPTNNLDIETLTVLEDYLADFPGAVMAVSHDRWFIDKTMDHLLTLTGDGGVSPFTGSFEDYLLKAAKGTPQQVESDPPQKSPYRSDREKTKLSYREQREWEELAGDIANLEEQLAALAQELNSAGSDYQRLSQLHCQSSAIEKELDIKVERWLELCELKENLEAKAGSFSRSSPGKK